MTPSSSSPQRRLAAVMFADLVGYSALSSRNEPAALRLIDLFQDCARVEVERQGGGLIKFLGDGALAQFTSTEAALHCAFALQEAVSGRAEAEGLTGSLRIGIHVGDVTASPEGDIHGDGVNVAARLQESADPGQVMVSEPVWQHLRPRPEFCFVPLGERRLKGSSEPLRLYAAGSASRGLPRVRRRAGWTHLPRARALAGGITVLLAVGGFLAYVKSGGDVRHLLQPARAEAVEPRSIAVLPFRSMSMDPANEYFSDGMTEEILTQLAQLRGLRVISHTSVIRYKMMPKPLKEIGEELGVDHVLEGSVRRDGDRVRVTAQLINAKTDEHLWADNFDRELTDILALQSEIAQQITAALETELSPEEHARMVQVSRREVEPAAYEEYLRGLHLANTGSFAEAARTLGEAIRLDPDFAPAYAANARLHYFLGYFGELPPQQAFGKTRELATRAVALDEHSAEGHAALALARLHLELNWKAAEEHFRRALAISPSNADVRHDYAHLLLAMGRNDASAVESARAADLDPLNVMLTACAGWHRLAEKDYDSAIAGALTALSMMPDMPWPELVLGWAYEQKGMYPEAIVLFRRATSHAGGSSFALAALAHALAASGDRDQALEILAELEQRARTRYVSAYDIAVVHAGLRDEEEALLWLERAFAERSGFFIHATWDARLASLRSNARFAQLIRRMGLEVQDSRAAGFPPPLSGMPAINGWPIAASRGPSKG